MEDSVGEEERREQGITMVKARQEDERVEAGSGGGGEPGEEDGFLSAVASKIGAAMAGGDESSGDDGAAVNATAGASSGEEEKREDGGSHGGGGIFHKFMSSSHAPSPDSGGASEAEEVKGEEKSQDAGGEQGGNLGSVASRIGMAMSGANGNGNHHSTADDALTSNGETINHRKGEEEKGDEANGGGILSNMASKIGAAMSSANGNGNNSTVGEAKMSNGDAVDHLMGEERGKSDDTNGGILSAMASKIGTAMSGANGEGNHGGSGEDGKTSNGDAAAGGSKVDEKKGGEANGGGIVDQIRSSLSSDDQAPEADEASLLIAIIED